MPKTLGTNVVPLSRHLSLCCLIFMNKTLDPKTLDKSSRLHVALLLFLSCDSFLPQTTNELFFLYEKPPVMWYGQVLDWYYFL